MDQYRQMTTQELRDELISKKKTLQVDISNWEPKSKPSVEGMKNRAKQDIPVIENKLANKVLQDSVMIVVADDVASSDKIVDSLGNKQMGSEVMDYFDLEHKMFDRLFEGINTNNGYPLTGADFQSRLNTLLMEVGDIIGLPGMSTITVPADLKGVAKTKDDTIKKINMIFNRFFQGELKREYFSYMIFEVIKQKFESEDKVAFIVKNVPLDMLKSIRSLTGRSAVITQNNNVQDAIVVEKELDENKLAKDLINKLNPNAKSGNVKTTNKKQTKKEKRQ